MFDDGGVFVAPLLGKVGGIALLLLRTGPVSALAAGSGLGSHGKVLVLVELRRVCQPYHTLSVKV